MLKMTIIELQLILDIDMYIFIKKGMRGGISYIAKGHSKAKNKNMQSYAYYVFRCKWFIWLGNNGFRWLNEKEIVNSIECNCTDIYIYILYIYIY